jgi:hypothetical protein
MRRPSRLSHAMSAWSLVSSAGCLRRHWGLLAGIAALFSACALPLRSGDTVHYVIIGFGVVSVRDNAKDAIVATDTQDLGLTIADRPGVRVALGYVSSTVVAVADGAKDVRVETARRPFGPFIVDTASADLEPSSQGIEK